MLGLDPFSTRSIITGHLLCSAQALEQTLNPASEGFGRSLSRAPMLRLGHCRSHCSPFPQGSHRAVNAAPPFCSFPSIIEPKAEVLKCTSTCPSNRALLSASKLLGQFIELGSATMKPGRKHFLGAICVCLSPFCNQTKALSFNEKEKEKE